MSANVINVAVSLPRWVKRSIVVTFDICLCVISTWSAFYLRMGYFPPIMDEPAMPIMVSIVLALPLFIAFGLYRSIFRFAGLTAALSIVGAVLSYAAIFSLIFAVYGQPGVPRTIGLIQPILLLLLTISSRALVRMLLAESSVMPWRKATVPRVLIYGAGSAGRQLANALKATNEMHLIGFVDDDAKLWKSTIDGVKIHGPTEIVQLVEMKNVTDLLLAIPSAARTRRTEIVHALRDLNLHVRTLPGLLDMARGNVSIRDLKDLDIEDLLGREAVPPDTALLRAKIAGKVILVSGAGGSIGSELCRQIVVEGPAMLLLVELGEYNLYTIHQELSGLAAEMGADAPIIVPLIASVVDERRIREIISTWHPDTIYHAAAYKHVPLVEHNATEGIKNNVFGTLTLARLAMEYQVRDFVLISTDKAVRPTNIMGTSKRLAEMTLQAFQTQNSQTRFSMVRFGNVLGSSGSVVPLFRRQIAEGGPVTITDLRITRYFMTIAEAAQLVLQAGAMAQGGDVFVLDMGEPVKIYDLARNMIELSGLSVRDTERPDGDIAIEVVGLRPGEKLYEELLIGDNPQPTSHPRIMRSNEAFLPWGELTLYLTQLSGAVDLGDASRARALLRNVVPEFSPSSELVDWIAQAHPTTSNEASLIMQGQTSQEA